MEPEPSNPTTSPSYGVETGSAVPGSSASDTSLKVSRRTLLRLAGAAAASVTALLPDLSAGLPKGPDATRSAVVPRAGALKYKVWLPGAPHGVLSAPVLPVSPIDFSITFLRTGDLLLLDLDFYNFVFRPNPARLERKARGDAYLVVRFAPQSFAEQAFFQADPTVDNTNPKPVPGNETPTHPPAVPARMAHQSRLAFKIPDATETIAFTPAALLSWLSYELNVVPTALAPDDPVPVPGFVNPLPITQPTITQTAIEAPWQLILSPHKSAKWAHSASLVTHGDAPNQRTELWHTRLGVSDGASGVDELTAQNRTVRAVWMTDFERIDPPPDDSPPDITATVDNPFRTSMTPRDRYEIVRLTSDYLTPTKPVQVDRLMLSSLGAWMNVRGAWEPPPNAQPPLSLEEWRHRATMGRDHFVRVVKKGYLCPFGHRASLIKITERKIEKVTGSQGDRLVAVLRQRTFIVVREPEKSYPTTDGGQPHSGRGTVFSKVGITTLTTPDLVNPASSKLTLNAPATADGPAAFWPQVSVGGEIKDYLFHLYGVDVDGKRIEFAAPLVFVSSTIALTLENSDATKADAKDVAAAYNNAGDARRKVGVQGQKIAFAPSSAAKPGDTWLETIGMKWKAETPASQVDPFKDQPNFYPALETADVRLSAVQQLSDGPVNATSITLHDAYLQNGLPTAENLSSHPNKGAVFAALVTPTALGFKTDKSGGVATPNMNIVALSRTLGPVGGTAANLSTFVGGSFDPAKFFSGLPGDAIPKIFGAISLVDIVKSAVPIDGTAATEAKLPKITTRTIYNPSNKPTGVPVAVETKLHWAPVVEGDTLGFFIPSLGSTAASLSLESTVLAKLDSTPPTFQVVGSLKNFKVRLLGSAAPVLIIPFEEFTFTAQSGKKPDLIVKVQAGGVEFTGILTFVNELRKYIGSGSDIDVTANGITATYKLAIPTIAVGALSIQNAALTVGFDIPFSGKPVRARVAFSERANPFLLTVTLFGGGGFFAFAAGLDGFEIIEAALEAGGNYAFNIGVASGGVHVMLGFYYKLEIEGGQEKTSLTGYVRLGGAVQVLGIVAVSVEFYLGLTWDTTDEVLWGQASLTVEIDIGFFSKSVKMHVEKTFAGGKTGQAMVQPAAPTYLASLAPGVGSASARRSSSTGSIRASLALAASSTNGRMATPDARPLAAAVSPPTFADFVPAQADWDAYAQAFA